MSLAKEHEETEQNLVDVEELMKKYEVGELLPEDFRATVIIDLLTTDLKDHLQLITHDLSTRRSETRA